MRVIIRFSISHERNSALRNALAKILASKSIYLQANTATYENSSISQKDLADVLSDFFIQANTHRGKGKIDHFWMYSDA